MVPVCPQTHYAVRSFEDDVKRILSDKPDIIKNNDFVDNLYKQIAEDKANGVERETMLLYHFSDLHWDFKYTPGASNKCGDMVCCRPESGAPKNPEDAAGKWGDYKCDANPKLFAQLKYTFNMTGNPDFIAWTGDNIQHMVEEDPKETTNNTVIIAELVQQYSPDSIVFPIHGNHEFNPMNVQNMSKTNDPVITYVSDAFKPWLTDKTYNEYREKTYFSYEATTHPHTTPEFNRKMNNTRIIALNSQN